MSEEALYAVGEDELDSGMEDKPQFEDSESLYAVGADELEEPYSQPPKTPPVPSTTSESFGYGYTEGEDLPIVELDETNKKTSVGTSLNSNSYLDPAQSSYPDPYSTEEDRNMNIKSKNYDEYYASDEEDLYAQPEEQPEKSNPPVVRQISLLQQLDEKKHQVKTFEEFFSLVQQTNIATSIEQPSIKLSRSLRFSGHNQSAERIDLLVKAYSSQHVVSSSSTTISEITRSRNWNEEFQLLMELPDSRIKFLGLRNLEHDFVYAAETYGRIIISESFLPIQMRTISPVDVGGIAGGQKFIVQGILFKFAIDTSGLYGGDHHAMKAASHELKGLMNYFHCGIKELHVPLMALIDYRGFRLMAISLLPLSSSTICYGSADAARTVHNSNLEMNDLMKRAGKLLFLKPHPVGSSETTIYGPGDIEGHQGKDGRLYLLDFARVAPPQPPAKKGEQLYKLFRMEFLRSYAKPLCSDGFSGIISRGHSAPVNTELREAYKYYLDNVIPNVAKNLDENPISQVELLGRVLHREGVNMRHLGFIRSAVCNEKIKEFILLEAIARTIKSHLNELLRVEMRRCGIPSQEPFLKLVLDLFNLILLNNGEYSSAYWNNQLIPHLLEKFPKLLSLEEQQAEYQLWTKISFFDLFSRLQIITAVKISSEAMTELSKSPARFEFVEPDIVALNTRVAHLNLIDYADGMALYYEAENRVSNLDTQRRLLQLARIRLESCLESMANNTVAMLQLSNILRVMASKLKNESEQLECFEKACSGFETITKSSPDESIKRKAHFLWAKTLWTKTKRAFHTRSSEEQILSAFLNQIQQARNIDPESSDPIILLVKSILFRAKRESPKASIALLQQAQKILQEFQSSFSWDWDLHVIQARVAFYQFRNYFHSNETPCEEEQKLLEPQFICKMFEKIETTSPGGLEKVFKDLDDIQNFPESAFSPAFICSQFSDVVSERLAKFLAQQSVTKLCFNSLNLAQIQNFKIFRKIFEITLSLTSLKFTNLKWLSNFVEIFFDCHAPISFLECSDCAGMTVNDFKIILEHLPGLRELRVSHSTSITHLDWISVIPAIPAELTSLELEAIEHLNDSVVSQLVSHCPKLTCLLLKDLSGISNQVFRVIQSLTNLEQLKVIQCSEVNDTSAIESFSAPISILQLLGTGYQYSGSSKLSKLMPLKYLTCSNGDLHLFTSERVSCNTTLSSIKSIVSLTASGFGHFIQVNSTMVGPSHFYNVIIKNPQLPFTNNETQLFKYTTSAFGPSIRVNVDVKGSQSFQTNFPAKSASMLMWNVNCSILGHSINIAGDVNGQGGGQCKVRVDNQHAGDMRVPHRGFAPMITVEPKQNLGLVAGLLLIPVVLYFSA